MAGIKISELPEANCICGNELVPIVQGSCTKFVSASAIGGGSGGSGITSITSGCGLAGGGNSGSINIGMDSNCFNAYNNTTTTLAAASGNWDSTYVTVEGLSSNWDQSACAGLNCVGDITGLCVGSGLVGGGVIGDVNVCIDAVCSVAWNGTTSIVAANSATWGSGGGGGGITGFDAGGDGITIDDSDTTSVVVEVDSTVARTNSVDERFNGNLTIGGNLSSVGNILSGGVNIDQLFSTDSAEAVTVADVAGTNSTFGSSVLYFSSDSVTYGPVAASVQGNYYKPTAASTDELSVAFYSDAAEVEIKIERSQSSLQVFIDDRPVHEYAVAGYQNRLLKLSHTEAKVRKYELRGKSYGFGGVYTNTAVSDYQVWPYERRKERPLLLVMTDSYGTAFNTTFGISFAEKLAEYLDMDLHSDSLNSSGWSSTGSSATSTRAAGQIQLTRDPAVILACLGYNDKSSPNQTNIETGINNWHSTITGTFTSANIMLASPWTPVGVETNLTTVSGYISGRATALGADFIDINGVVTANNQAVYTSNDNTHPTLEGHEYIARRLEALMLRTGNVPASN